MKYPGSQETIILYIIDISCILDIGGSTDIIILAP